MSDSLMTHLDAPYAQQPETRAAARRVMERADALDLLPMLGLDGDDPVQPDYVILDGRMRCRACLCPVKADGLCRRERCGGAR